MTVEITKHLRIRNDELAAIRQVQPTFFMEMLRSRIHVRDADGRQRFLQVSRSLRWLDENCTGLWHYEDAGQDGSYIMFESKADRVAFALRFAGNEP